MIMFGYGIAGPKVVIYARTVIAKHSKYELKIDAPQLVKNNKS